MEIKIKLEVDHFFFAVSSEEFEKIVGKVEIYKHFRDVSTDTSETSYRGLYLTFYDGTYLEIIYPHKDFIDGTFGLSLADFRDNCIEASQFSTPQKIQKKEIYQEGDYWYSLYDCPRKFDDRVYVRAMEYSKTDLENRLSFIKQKTYKIIEFNVYNKIKNERIFRDISIFSKELNFDNINFEYSERESVDFKFKDEAGIYSLTFKLR